MFSPEDASRQLNCRLLEPVPGTLITGASLDSRKINAGELFVALPGAVQDGHVFLEQAYRRGASAALVRRSYLEAHPGLRQKLFSNLLVVEDPQAAMGQLAAWRRQLFQGPVIGVTGSVGKTSTKEMLGYLLSFFKKGHVNAGNFNNHLGLPLSLMGLNPAHGFCLAELGASHQGEIAHLAGILRPTHGILTCVAPSHMEGFGSLEAIYETKLELAAALPEGAPVIIPDNDAVLLEKSKRWNRRWLTVGESAKADYRISELALDSEGLGFVLNGTKKYRIPVQAGFLARNAAMAAAMADCLGFSLAAQPEHWTGFNMPSGRFERRSLNGVTVIFDGYNASPQSFEESLRSFRALEIPGKRAVVFSDMLELGTEALRYHRELGEALARGRFDAVGCYGEWSKAALDVYRKAGGKAAFEFKDAGEAGDFLAEALRPGDGVLLKASRGMKIEKVLERFQSRLADADDAVTSETGH